MTSAAKLTPPVFFGKMIGSGFSFDKVQEKGVAANRGASPADTLANFESVVTSVKHPPGPTQTWLGETIVHSEDIRRALGIQHKYPTDAVVTVADFYKGSNLLIGSKSRIAGLTLRATDADWSHGTGPEVSGPILSLVMAMTGPQAGGRRSGRRRRGHAAVTLLVDDLGPAANAAGRGAAADEGHAALACWTL